MSTQPVRVAMWSGPRNISTAMMRAFGNRGDCAVIDEPFYAAYLAASGAAHPMREAVLASQPSRPEHVVKALLGELPGAVAVQYQKHMTHHMLPQFDLGWVASCRSAFLIRAPALVLASYRRKRQAVTLADIGIVRQAEIFDREAQRLSRPPPVIEAEDVLRDPQSALTRLCAALEIPFSPRMLQWPPGRRDTDGVWAAHWYGSVEQSTGFRREEPSVEPLDGALRLLCDEATPFYERLRVCRL